MNKLNNVIFRLTILSLLNIVPILFLGDEMNKEKIDIYLFHERLRWPENIAHDLAGLFSTTLLICTIYKLIETKTHKKYVGVFLISSIFNTIGYFLFYSQKMSLFLAPYIMLHLLLITFNAKRKNVE